MSDSLTGSNHLVDYNEPLLYKTFYDGSELVFADGFRMPVPCGMTVCTDGSTQFLRGKVDPAFILPGRDQRHSDQEIGVGNGVWAGHAVPGSWAMSSLAEAVIMEVPSGESSQPCQEPSGSAVLRRELRCNNCDSRNMRCTADPDDVTCKQCSTPRSSDCNYLTHIKDQRVARAEKTADQSRAAW